jgi:hypothetical protein
MDCHLLSAVLLLLATDVSGLLNDSESPCGTHEECVVIQTLFFQACGPDHKQVNRTVNLTTSGYEATTTSPNKTVALLLQRHVESMRRRLVENRPINNWDPLYAAIFSHSENLSVHVTNLTDGVHVIESGSTDCATSIAQAHAGVVDLFTTEGMTEMQRAHQVPAACPFAGFL